MDSGNIVFRLLTLMDINQVLWGDWCLMKSWQFVVLFNKRFIIIISFYYWQIYLLILIFWWSNKVKSHVLFRNKDPFWKRWSNFVCIRFMAAVYFTFQMYSCSFSTFIPLFLYVMHFSLANVKGYFLFLQPSFSR